MKQFFPTNPPLEIVHEPPLVLELIALGAGCVAGYIGWIVHRTYFVTWYWTWAGILKHSVSLPTQFDSVYALLNVEFALMQALAVGFFVGAIARRYPYWLAATAMLLTFFLKVVHDILDLWHSSRSPYEVPWVGVLLALIYILVPLFGACVGQLTQAIFVRRE